MKDNALLQRDIILRDHVEPLPHSDAARKSPEGKLAGQQGKTGDVIKSRQHVFRARLRPLSKLM